MRLIDTLDRPSTQQLDIGDLTKISLRSLSAYQPVSQPLTYIDLNRVSDKSMIYSSLPFILYGNHIHIIWKTTSETNEKLKILAYLMQPQVSTLQETHLFSKKFNATN